MTLIKTSLLNGIAVVIKMLTLLGINKVLAIYVGPAGYAAIGQFQNAVQMITTFASGAINTGVVKYTAEFHDNEEKQRTVWRTAGTIALTGAVLAGISVAILSKSLAGWFLKDESYSGVFLWFAVTLVFFVFNTLLLAILNGKKEIHRYVVANISGSLFALFVTSLMTMQYGLYGALVALAVYQSLTFFVTFSLCYKASWFKLRFLFGAVDKKAAKNLAKYTAMALTGAACVPVSHILIRNHLGETLGWESAGYWEAMWRLSSAYLMLITTTLTVYFLPRFSELKESIKINKEIFNGYMLIMPLSILCGVIIYCFREIIIRFLFSSEFADMEVLFLWQVIGDVFKIASFIIGYFFLSKARFKLFMFIEVYFAFQFYFFVTYFVRHFGLEGASMAYMFNYLGCFIFVLVMFVFRPE
ncbi:O-antigen translocase [Rheinheimera sp. 1928-s]|uniref:O-antigen translocase n=1 Tax=Rheinheimera sp. 1928-s TaxID=3033803 RepID=UPI002623B34B|nr:O-antigen translocase [Rheinheimera sp. 1928-s]MDF3125763.1 O-antigen translocase [Rheinheimera sp. 1928-s]